MKKMLVAATAAIIAAPSLASAQFAFELDPTNGDIYMTATEGITGIQIISDGNFLIPANAPTGGSGALPTINFGVDNNGDDIELALLGNTANTLAGGSLGIPAPVQDVSPFVFMSYYNVTAAGDVDPDGNGFVDDLTIFAGDEMDNNVQYPVTIRGAIPEPTSILGLAGLAGLAMLRRRA